MATDAGQWRLADGTVHTHSSSDDLVDPDWFGLPPSDVIRAVNDAGLQFDRATGRGVTLHMLSCDEHLHPDPQLVHGPGPVAEVLDRDTERVAIRR